MLKTVTVDVVVIIVIGACGEDNPGRETRVCDCPYDGDDTKGMLPVCVCERFVCRVFHFHLIFCRFVVGCSCAGWVDFLAKGASRLLFPGGYS